MDAKSMAKSKRAHTQHLNRKHHPHQKSKVVTAPIGPSNTDKVPGKGSKEKPRSTGGSRALPSNWDRYEDEDDIGIEGPSPDGMGEVNDVAVPKSKGADYAHLIFEAKLQYQTSSSRAIFPSLNDVLTEQKFTSILLDFDQGLGSCLYVRGESIFSWIQNDNFVVEDKAAATHEASFLSLDLHTLAEQLAKVDLSKRLFMEAEILPPELCSGESSVKHNPDQDQAIVEKEAVKGILDELSALVSTNEGTLPQLSTESKPRSIAKLSKFEAKSAEAELDVLLSSLGEIKLPDSPVLPENVSHSLQTEISTSSLGNASDPFPMKKSLGFDTAPITVDIDDSVDDLLRETSSLVGPNHASLVQAAPVDIVSGPSVHPTTSKSKLLDDFESWLDTI